MNNGKLYAGLALGALVGSALTCFAHSKHGHRLRREACHKFKDLRNEAGELAHQLKEKAKRMGEDVADQVKETAQDVKQAAQEAKQKIQ